ncbi:MAG: glycosyltransferase family 2 protein [Elusimicrobia bacterium]|nr:glycosyltransferase family 2 protein [Elusimicrobiota bacterium]MBU2614648.1 glycosyltransferase family 2 protein [Elusimicrobiota bacterium]
MQNQIEPKVCVIIPNKNGAKHLYYSLDSLAKTNYKNYNVILVDDGSADESLIYVKDKFPEIKILENIGKKGFAGAVNTGIKYALSQNAHYVAVFNTDIKILPEWINLVVDLFDKLSTVGLIGYTAIPKEEEISFVNWKNIDFKYEEIKDSKGVEGCLYLCPSAVFRHIGFFDEDYFMYGEDNDLFHRLLKANYKIIKTNIPVWHYGEGSSINKGFFATWLAYRNALRFSIKNENIIGVFFKVLSLLNQGCNPFRKRKKHNSVYKRMRRYNPILNFLIIIGSILWNIYHLPITIKQRNIFNSNCKE